jgi:hypothetical protein
MTEHIQKPMSPTCFMSIFFEPFYRLLMLIRLKLKKPRNQNKLRKSTHFVTRPGWIGKPLPRVTKSNYGRPVFSKCAAPWTSLIEADAPNKRSFMARYSWRLLPRCANDSAFSMALGRRSGRSTASDTMPA